MWYYFHLQQDRERRYKLASVTKQMPKQINVFSLHYSSEKQLDILLKEQVVLLTFEHYDDTRIPFVGNQSRSPSHHHQSTCNEGKVNSPIGR